jgi:threonine dehydrogenase-like Zn-dependent dehydrogenase
MKIAMLRGPRDLRIEEQSLDTGNLGPHEIWVETRISAFKIGTDRGNYEGAERVPGAPDYPRWVGDSNLGIVRGVGGAVTCAQVGDRIVTRAPHQSEYITSDEASMVKVPAGVADEDAVYAHLYALSAHCYHKAQFRPGENVAVVGLGTLGLGAVAIGPLFGGRVVAVGNDEYRLSLARSMGAHATLLYNDPDLLPKLDAFTGGNGIDLVVLTANPWPAFRASVEMVRPNGRVSIVALLGRGEAALDFNPLSLRHFYAKGISLIAVSGTAGYLYPAATGNSFCVADHYAADREAAHMLSLMADGRLEPKRLVTHRFHYSEMAEA